MINYNFEHSILYLYMHHVHCKVKFEKGLLINLCKKR